MCPEDCRARTASAKATPFNVGRFRRFPPTDPNERAALMKVSAVASDFLRLRRGRRRQRDDGFGGEQKEGEGLLQIEAHDAVGMTQIADRDVLADMQIEIAAARG